MEHARLLDAVQKIKGTLSETSRQQSATSDSDHVQPRIVRIIIDPVHEQFDALHQQVLKGDPLSEYDQGRYDALRAIHDARQPVAVRD